MVNVPMERFLPLLDPQDTELFWTKGNIDTKAKTFPIPKVAIVYRAWSCVLTRLESSSKVSHKYPDDWIGWMMDWIMCCCSRFPPPQFFMDLCSDQLDSASVRLSHK